MDDEVTSSDGPGRAGRLRTLLVTGFGPFEDCFNNPTDDVANLVHGKEIAGVRVVGLRLDTTWRYAWPSIRDAVEERAPDALLMLGAAPHPFVRLELVARNLAVPSPDAIGELPPPLPAQQVVEGGPGIHETTLPLPWFYEGLKSRREYLSARGQGRVTDVMAWRDAGVYVCNYVFYRAMHELGDRVACRGFIHIPRYDGPSPENPEPGEILACGTHLVMLMSHWLANAPETARLQ